MSCMRWPMIVAAVAIPAWADQPDPMLPTTTPPIVYVINYTGDYFTKPETIEQFRAAPPDLLHVGKAVPISHHWGPTRLYQGENQYTGGPGHTLSRQNIALLTPEALGQRIETIRRTLGRYHAIGIGEIVPYISYHTVAGDHQKREGFWAFYDRWDAYAKWAGPRPQRDPFDWLVVDRKARFVGGSCGGYSPAYYAPLHRYRACINHPDWAEWHRRLIRMVAEVGYDGCFVDNSTSDACFCSHCKQRFAEFIARSGDVPWVKRLTSGLHADQIALDAKGVPSLLVRRWRWLQTRDHLGMLRDIGRQVRKGFTIFPNGNRIDCALIVGAKSDRLMFESTFSPGIMTAGRLPKTGEVTIEVSDGPAGAEPFVFRYRLRDRATWMEMKADVALPPQAQIGQPASLTVKIVSLGDSLRDDDAAEDIHLVLREVRGGAETRVDLTPKACVGGSGSSRKPRQPPVTLTGTWTPTKAGVYEVFIGFRYTDDGHAEVTRNRPHLGKLAWGRVCRSHQAELLYTQHMRARSIYLGYEAIKKGWENVQELALAEMAAFSGGGGFSGRGGPQAKYRAFFKSHADLFDGWQQTAPAAVLYATWGSNPLSPGRPNSTPTIHGHLGRTARLFVALRDTALPDRTADLAGLGAIYLQSPAYEMVPGQIEGLRDYVRQGGQVVLGSTAVRINGRSAMTVLGADGKAAEHALDKGKVSLWRSDRPVLPTQPVTTTDGLRGQLRFALYRKADRLALHVVNYNVCLLDASKRVLDVPVTPIRIPLPDGWRSATATCFDPDATAGSVPCTAAGGAVRFELPKTHVYQIVLIEKR